MKAKRQSGQGGYSLVELVMSIAVSSFLMAGMIGGFTHQRKTYWVQNQLNEMQQNLRSSVDMAAREIRMAGSGVMIDSADIPLWFDWTPGITNIVQVADNVTANSDTVTIVGAVETPQSQLIYASNAGDTTITVTPGTGSRFNGTTKKVILIGKTEVARVVSVSGDTLTVSIDPVQNGEGLAWSYAAGSDIELVKIITYSAGVDTTVTPHIYYMERDDHTGDFTAALDRMIGINVEDFQAELQGSHVLITLGGRTQEADWTYNDPNQNDGYRRRSIQTKVLVRNKRS